MQTYLIYDKINKAVKIGRSHDPASRLRQLQTGHPHPLELLAVIEGDIERYLHRAMQEYRLQGEWFKIGGAAERLALQIKKWQRRQMRRDGMHGHISYDRHRATMTKAYRVACDLAALMSVEPLPPAPLLPVAEMVTVRDHQAALKRAREYYKTGVLDTQ